MVAPRVNFGFGSVSVRSGGGRQRSWPGLLPGALQTALARTPRTVLKWSRSLTGDKLGDMAAERLFLGATATQLRNGQMDQRQKHDQRKETQSFGIGHRVTDSLTRTPHPRNS